VSGAYNERGPILESPSAPMAVANVFVGERYQRGANLILSHWRGGWWRWWGSHWAEVEHRAIRSDAYRYTEHAFYLDEDEAKGKVLKPWNPNRRKVADVLEAMAAVCHLPESIAQPSWIEDIGAGEGPIVACANGLLDVERRRLLHHDPRFFNQTAVPFDYDPEAPAPRRWLRFLADLWGDDTDSIAALQEWFGYVVSGRLDLHKILLLVGPTRGGKGAIARVLGALIGRENVAGPTLSSLSGDFGLAPLLGKPLAVISDARLSGRNSEVVVERLLAISGEDTITVNRKYREQWTGKLPSRFMVISNELPRLGDASAAIAGRFVTLLLTRSWLGHEDHTLEPDLHRELPGILNWSLDGLVRLSATNRFTRPASTDEAMIALQDLASPVSAFLRDRCTVDPGDEVPVDDLYRAWGAWCEENGHRKSNKQTFGRDLRAAVPHVRRARPRVDRADGDERDPRYQGVALKWDPQSPGPRPTATHTHETAAGSRWDAVQRNVGLTREGDRDNDGEALTPPVRDREQAEARAEVYRKRGVDVVVGKVKGGYVVLDDGEAT
jgi:putative DNA primase/helicase